MGDESGGQITLSVKQLVMLVPALVALSGGGGSWLQFNRLGADAAGKEKAVDALQLAREEIAEIRNRCGGQLKLTQEQLDFEHLRHEQTVRRLVRMMGAMGCITPEAAEEILKSEDFTSSLLDDREGLASSLERNLDSVP